MHDSAVVSVDAATADTVGAQSVLQRGHDLYRRATFVQPGLTKAAASSMAADDTFDGNATFPATGNTQNQGAASVLYVEKGPSSAGCPPGATGCIATSRAAGAGVFFAFPALGSDPNVVAFDETTGLRVWSAHVTAGNDGLRGTPVIDAASRRLFVVTGPDPHLVHALSIDDGTEVTSDGWPVTLSMNTITAGSQKLDSKDQNQHGALLLQNGILYIPFGGQYGDGGSYLGWIVAVDISDPTKLAGWATRSARSGIWGAGGLTGDGTYVYGVTGDTTGLPRAISDSEEVVRVKGMAELVRDATNLFVPTEWQTWDRPAGDLDFGASTPSFVPLPQGAAPKSVLIAPAKGGRLYILDGEDLSAGRYPTPGGELVDLVVSKTTSESVYTAPTIYSTSSGLHATINVGDGAVGCPGTTPSSSAAIVSVLVEPGKTPIARTVWCAPASGGRHLNYPPISTTTDGASGDPLVWFVDGNQLTALDGDTGERVFTTTGASCDGVPGMSFPIAVKNRIVVSALGHLCSWSLGGQ
ncbi:MAG: hypothetical protein ABI321_13995 [Polyangia bacterium]